MSKEVYIVLFLVAHSYTSMSPLTSLVQDQSSLWDHVTSLACSQYACYQPLATW